MRISFHCRQLVLLLLLAASVTHGKPAPPDMHEQAETTINNAATFLEDSSTNDQLSNVEPTHNFPLSDSLNLEPIEIQVSNIGNLDSKSINEPQTSSLDLLQNLPFLDISNVENTESQPQIIEVETSKSTDDVQFSDLDSTQNVRLSDKLNMQPTVNQPMLFDALSNEPISNGHISNHDLSQALRISEMLNVEPTENQAVLLDASPRSTSFGNSRNSNLNLQNNLQFSAISQQEQINNQPPVIESAKLLSHIVSENNRPFEPINLGNANIEPLPVSSISHFDDDHVLLELLAPRDQMPSNAQMIADLNRNNPQLNQFDSQIQIVQEGPIPNQFDVTINNEINNNPTDTFVQDFQPVTNQAGSIMINAPAGRQSQQISDSGSSGQTLSVSLDDDFHPLGHSGLRIQPAVRFGASSLLRPRTNNRIVLNNQRDFSQNTQSNFQSINSLPVQTPVTSANFGVKETESAQFSQNDNIVNHQNPNSEANSLTVGDLVMSLDGNNGIRVISLNDLQNDNSFTQSEQNANIMQQLRDIMATEDKSSDIRTQQLNGMVDLSVGVPLPMAVQQETTTKEQQELLESTTTTAANEGRQFSFNDQADQDTGVIDDLISDTAISTDTGDIGVPLPADTGLDTTLTTTVDDDTDTYDEYDYEYDDDDFGLPPQPPNVFRTGLSDILFTKGQWVGTLLGGLIDVGSAISSSVSRIFKKSEEVTE